MKKHWTTIIGVAALLFVVSLPASALSLDSEPLEVDSETQALLDRSLKIGQQLFNAVEKEETVDPDSFDNRKEIQKYLKKNKCRDFTYKGYIVTTAEGEYYYLIASKGADVIIGRHFKAPLRDGKPVVSEFESSTNTCLDLGSIPEKKNVAGMYATTFKPFPDEFHVMAAALGKLILLVGSEQGIFKVNSESIALIERSKIEDIKTAPEPVWRTQLTFWCDQNIEPVMERTGLSVLAHEDTPDDVPVVFYREDIEPEVMWVKVTCYDEANGHFMGTLINEPYHIRNLHHGDNVVFIYSKEDCIKAPDGTCYPRAVTIDNSFTVPGLPGGSDITAFQEQIIKGRRAYVQGNFGHNQPEIEKSIKILKEALSNIPEDAADSDKFLAYFLLARCCAETYDTRLAIDSFRNALRYKPEDFHANMGLLAEYSIAVWMKKDYPGEDWEQVFTDHMNILKEKFKDNPGFQSFYKMIYVDETERAVKKDGLTGEEKEMVEKFGPGTIRWKHR